MLIPFAYIEDVYTPPKNSLDRATIHYDIVYGIIGNLK